MNLSKNQKLTALFGSITVIVTIIGLIVVPISQNQAIIEYSFGNIDPSGGLYLGADYYFVSMIIDNSGRNNGDVIITAISTNAEITFDNEYWGTQIAKWLLVHPDEPQSYKIYIKPDSGTDTFTLELKTEKKYWYEFQELRDLGRVQLTYQLQDGIYKLID